MNWRLQAQVDLLLSKINGLKLNLAIAKRDDDAKGVAWWSHKLAAAEADLAEARWILATDPEQEVAR